MNISFNLVSPSAEKSSVRVVVTHNGKVYRKSVGLSIPTKLWSAKRQRPIAPDYADKLKSIRIKLEAVLNDFSTDDEVRNALGCDLLHEEVKTAPRRRNKNAPTFWDYFDVWATQGQGATRQKKSASTTIRRLMGDALTWKDIDGKFYAEFIDRMDAEGFSKNYQGVLVQRLKTMMNAAYKRGYHDNTAYQSFKKFKEPVTNVYLTAEEMERLWEYKPKGSAERKARDLAWLGFKTAARFSDYSRLALENVVDGKIRFKQIKTSGEVVLPCSPRVVEILKRNGGVAPRLCQQQFNRHIKEICRACGICDRVEIVVSRGASREHQYKEKWELVASHTFRRSAIVALHFAGVPARQLMYLSGHTTLDAFFKYLCISREDNATRLSGLEFFK